MPMVWTEAAVAKLFLGVLATSDVKVDHKALATYMGPECTVEAIKHKLRKLKAAEKDADAGTKLATGGGSGPSPATNGKVGKVPKNTKGSAKRKEMSVDDAEMDDGEDLDPTPSKPPKKSKLGSADSTVGYQEVVNDYKKEDGFEMIGGKVEDGEEV